MNIHPFTKFNDRRGERENMIKVGIIGSTGYAGAELVRLLMGHKEAEIGYEGAQVEEC